MLPIWVGDASALSLLALVVSLLAGRKPCNWLRSAGPVGAIFFAFVRENNAKWPLSVIHSAFCIHALTAYLP